MSEEQDKLTNPYQALRNDFGAHWSMVAEKIRELEERIEGGLNGGDLPVQDVRQLLRYSRLMRRHMAEAQAHADTLLEQMTAPSDLDDVKMAKTHSTEEEQAAIVEIQREMHRPSDTFMEVLKAVFMWRDNPEERLDREEPERQARPGE